MRPDRLTVLVGAVGATVACQSPTVAGFGPAYDPASLTAGQVYHWPLGQTISIYVDPAQVPVGLDLIQLTVTAADLWIRELTYREHRVRLVFTPAEADLLVRDPQAPLAPDTTGCGGPRWTESTGSTFFCPAGDTARTLSLPGTAPGRIKVIVTVDRRAVSTSSEFEAVLVHELGHAFGIGGHSSEPLDVMAAAPTSRRPTARDVRTLRYLIHRPPDIAL
jgi:hypothetical protein